MKKVFALVLMTLLVSSSALAFDYLITNDTSAVQEAGSMQGKAAILYLTASETLDKDGEASDLPDDSVNIGVPLKFRYGVMDNLEAFGIVSIRKWDIGDNGETGIGDLWLGAKYAVMPDGLLTVRGALGLPLGDDKKGLGDPGAIGVDVAAMTTKQMDAICLNGQAGIRFATEDSDTKLKPGLGFYVDGEGSYAFSDVLKAQLGLELLFRSDSEFDGTEMKDSGQNWVELNLGATYMIADNMGIKGDILFNVTGKNTEKNMGVLISYCHGF